MTGKWVTAEELQRRVHKIHHGMVLLVESTYVKMDKKAQFIDVELGSWWTIPGNVVHSKSGHPSRRASTRRMLCLANSIAIANRPIEKRRWFDAEDVKKRLHETYGQIVSLDETTYVKMCAPARFIDVEFGEYWMCPHDILRGGRQKGQGFHPVRRKTQRETNKRNIDLTRVKDKLLIVHNGIVTLVDDTFVKMKTNATFVDNTFGKWSAHPENVIRGTSHPKRKMQKIVKSSFASFVDEHWKTGQKLFCHGSYEVAVVRWLNDHNYDFDWQVAFDTPFRTPKNKISLYFVDVLIKTGPFSNTYVEIKGTWIRKNGYVGKAKWEWFHKEHPNSQLWMKPELTRYGILK